MFIMAINILIVDDNPNNLRLLSDILREKGYQARRAISGSLALKSLEAATFDLILMDINLPGMNGYEICEKIKQNPRTKNIPVIFISAYNEPLDKVKAFEVGGTDYITKPLNNEEVIARVENQIKIIKLQREISLQNLKLKQQYIERSEQLQKTAKSLKKSQKQLLHQSLHDNVTGLDNRLIFMGKLREACRKLTERKDYNFSILVIECKHLAIYNHILNFDLKDRILSEIARILRYSLPKDSTLAKLDAKNFVILLSDIQDTSIAIDLSKELYNKFQKSIILDSQEIFLDFHCGIVLGEALRDHKGQSDSQQAESLLQNGRVALSYAQEVGDSKYNYTTFTEKLNQEFNSKLNLKLKILQFIDQKKLKIDYLPVINLKNNQIRNLSSQVNWDIFRSKQISQEEIIDLINNKKCLQIFNKLLIGKCCNEIRKWQEQTLWDESSEPIWDKDFSIIIPLSLEQFFQPNLFEQVKQVIHKLNVDGENISLEIPDTTVLTKPIAAQHILQKLKELKIQLSINNFSINYFSLNQKYQFPFDNLVLDSYLIPDNSDNDLNRNLTQNIINKAHEYNMTVTVAGITQEQQIKELRELECDFGKGDWITQLIDPSLIL